MSVQGLNNSFYNAYNAYGFSSQSKTTQNTSVDVSNIKTDELKKSNQLEAPKECETCKNRRYQDRSDDPTVSFQSAQSIPTGMAYGIVASHENEHVRNEQTRAKEDGRKVVFQSVSIHTDICPECGKMYISGGTTRTVTKADNSQNQSNNNSQLTDIFPGMLFNKAG